MTRWSDALEDERAKAVEEAATALIDCGFRERSRGTWLGGLRLPDHDISVKITLPPEFPDKLPEIFLLDPASIQVQSHVERSGKICIATASGNLLDTDRPSALIKESIDRAKSVFTASEEAQASDVQLEFVAYWPEESSDTDIWSIADPALAGHEIVCATIRLNGTRLLFAESEDALKNWTGHVGATCAEISKSYFAKLARLPDPPRFEESISTAELEHILSTHMDEHEYQKWKQWDGNRRPPTAILMACELPDGSSTVFAARSARLSNDQERAIQNPYNRKQPPAKKVRKALQENAIGRRGVTRLDFKHLLNRTGGALELDDASIAVVGCGAVGSQIAVVAAASGVRFLTLIDHELMNAENIHRHALGAKDLKRAKATALAEHIEQRFAHTEVNPRIERIEEVFDKSPDIFNEIDLFVFALGDETLERRINSYLGPSVMRLHAWVEPLGVGGHCLTIPGGEQRGCYECLYARDEDLVLYNMSSLCARGQIFQRTTGGCAGTFTPFGYMDTLDVASRTARVISHALTDNLIKHALLSWIGNERAYLEAGFRLSKRGESLLLSRESYRDDIFRADCRVCSKW